MNKEILRLAIPNIVSNISVPLLSTVDVALMGQLSPIYLGAVGLGSMVFNFIYWNFGFLRMGTTGMVSQAFGARREAEMMRVLILGLGMALVIAAIIMMVSVSLFDLFFLLLDVPVSHREPLLAYCNIRIWAAPATLSIYVLIGWLFGRQNSLAPLVITILVNLVNILLSYILVYHYHMAIQGVAWGTTIAQYVGLISLLAYFGLRYRDCLSLNKGTLMWSAKDLKMFLAINRDLFIRTFCLTLSFVYLYRVSSQGGDIFLAINVIILQLLNWVSFGIDGFAYACESIVGKYVGLRDKKQVHRAVHFCFKWAFGLALFYSLAYSLCLGPIAALFTDDILVLDGVVEMFWVIVMLPLFSFSCYIWDGIYIGLLQSKYMRDSMIVSLIFFVGCHLLSQKLGHDLLWVSFLAFLLIRAILQYYYWLSKLRFTDIKKSL